jgi:tRNA A37 threonylcarbamoyladenosine biosynthesis protein TsaE
MGALASLLASELRPGDCYCLYGDVGAGKSVFSRAFIRAAADDPDLPVPSPT